MARRQLQMSSITSKTMTDSRSLLAILIMAFVCPAFETSTALAQGSTAITPTSGIGDLGTSVTAQGHTVQITGGTRPGNGTNLFHSFDQFNVGRGDTAQFLNTTPSLNTSNILSRVTGENPSSIFGNIDTMSYPGANLFLMNPAGIVFESTARLHVGGSVAFTTADYLRLAGTNGSNGGTFYANSTATSLLTSASVAAFGFLDFSSAPIVLRGSRLAVPPGQSIALVGGNITVQSGTAENGTVRPARLSAPGGQIIIVGVASPGEILSETLEQASNINGQSFGALGTIQISEQSRINTSGAGGGAIRIRGGSLIVDNSTISANSTKAAKSGVGRHLDSSWLGIGIEIAQDAIINNGAIVETNVQQGANLGSGGVRITADHISVSGAPKIPKFIATNPDVDIPPFAGIRSNVEPKSTAARSGDISLNAASSIQTTDYGKIETVTKSQGNAGHITLTASKTIDIAANVSSRVGEGSSGSSGNIRVDAQQGDILLSNFASVFNTTDGSTGTLGNIQVKAHDLQLSDASKIGGDNTSNNPQIPGNISITLDGQLTLAGGSFINTEAFGSTNSADLIIKSPTVLVTGKDGSGKHQSGLYTDTISSGNGGHLHLLTDNLRLKDGGILSSKSFIGFEKKSPSGHGGTVTVEGYRNPGTGVIIDGPGSGIFSNAEGIGAAGDIVVTANSVTLQNGGTISASTTGTAPSATGGSINIIATDQVTLSDGASITAHSTGPADAGTISINAGKQLDLMGKSSITTEAKQASGGDINLQATDRIRLLDSTLSASVSDGPGGGGNISIDPKLVLFQNSTVLAKADQGTGGRIAIRADSFVSDANTVVNADAGRGVNGTVTIQSPTSNISGTVGQLVSKTSPPQVLLQNRCVALAGGEQSTFLLSGRDALPAEPGGWLGSPISMEHWTGEDTEHASGLMVRKTESKRLPSIAAHKNDPTILSLRRLTPPGFLVRAFATGSTGCPS